MRHLFKNPYHKNAQIYARDWDEALNEHSHKGHNLTIRMPEDHEHVVWCDTCNVEADAL